MKKFKLSCLFIFITIIFVLVFYLTYNLLEPKAYDFMTRNVLTQKLPFDNIKKVDGSEDIVLIVIDNESQQRYRWPWKRDLYCKFLNYLKEYTSPKVIVMDSIITSTDDKIADKKFYNTINQFDNLVVGFFPQIEEWKNKSYGQKYDEKFGKKFSLNAKDETTNLNILYESMFTMPDEYFDVVKNIGSVSLITGFINGNSDAWLIDEIYRNHEYIFKYTDNKFYPSLALKSFLIYNNNPEMIVTNKSLKFPSLNYEVKLVKSYWQMTSPIKFYRFNPQGYSHIKYSAIDIMDSYDSIKNGKKPKIDPKVFENKVVIIGGNVKAGEGLNDNKNSPLINNHPGVDYQATAIDNILHNDFLKITPMWLNILLTIIGMLFIYVIISISEIFNSIIFGILAAFGYLLICAICFYFGIVINVITPIIMFVLTTIIAYTNKFIIENRSKEKVKSAMGKYMSQDVMKRIVQNIDNLGLGGKKSTVTVLFSDIRGFTSMSENMTAQEVSEILNEYFSEMEPIVTKYNGIINKFIGDAVMAVFGEPIQDKNHAENAVRCACEMLDKVKELQSKWVQLGKPKLEIGIGINTGEVFVGNIGSVNRMEYTVIGDTVNLASRLESYNKTYKTKLLISPTTYEFVKGITEIMKIPDVQIRGKANKIDIYEVLKIYERK